MKECTKQELERYVVHRIPTGSFLQAVLENNLMQAFARADDENILDMFSIVQYVYSHVPGNCYGSPAIVKAWLKERPTDEALG